MRKLNLLHIVCKGIKKAHSMKKWDMKNRFCAFWDKWSRSLIVESSVEEADWMPTNNIIVDVCFGRNRCTKRRPKLRTHSTHRRHFRSASWQHAGGVRKTVSRWRLWFSVSLWLYHTGTLPTSVAAPLFSVYIFTNLDLHICSSKCTAKKTFTKRQHCVGFLIKFRLANNASHLQWTV